MPRGLDTVGVDVWRYRILLFCDLMALIRLNWTNRQLRRILNDSSFVVEYQSSCWYLQPRYCRCARNLFYLDVGSFLDFSYDYRGHRDSEEFPEIHSMTDVSTVLRRMGRTPDMLEQSVQRAGGDRSTREPLPVRALDPRISAAFCDGFTKMYIDSTIVPMPRSMSRPVDQRRVHSVHRTVNERLPTETMEGFNHRVFWRDFHEVTDDMVYEVEMGSDPNFPLAEPYDHGYGPEEPDLIEEWLEYCRIQGADPYDPLYDDSECRGFRCIRWARSKMHDSAVGGSSYPLDLCLHRDNLTRSAGRLGVDYIDRMYIHLNRYHGGSPEWNTMDHRGVLYFMGLRYEHADEDFCNWALCTETILHALYAHMWLDALGNWTRMLMQHLHSLASDAETDLRFAGLKQRWQFLHSLCFAGPSIMPRTTGYNERTRKRDQMAVHLIFNSYYLEENRYLSNLVDHGDIWNNNNDLAQRSVHFLTSLLEQYDQPTPNFRSETQRVKDAYRLLRFAEYLTDFAEYVGVRVDDRTVVTRRRALGIYMASFVSLVAFCPGWKRMYHWKPSRTHEQTHWQVPRVNLQHNHRFRRYLDYCNRRTLYYHPNPSLLLNNEPQDATQGWRG